MTAYTATSGMKVASSLFSLLAGLALQATAARAQSAPPAPSEETPSMVSSLPPELSDPGGARARLREAGFEYGMTYTGEVQRNVRGGSRQHGAGDGRLELRVDANLEKLISLPGASFHANTYVIHGKGLTTCCVGSLMAVSNIEAVPTTRLFDLWLEQNAFDDRVSVRAGQFSADSEFLVSENASALISGTFGWPAITASNLPSGGPAYPLSAPGIRAKWKATEEFSIAAALFSGNPAGKQGLLDNPDPQRRNREGVLFPLDSRPFAIGELAYSHSLFGGEPALSGAVKLGGWYHFDRFADQNAAALDGAQRLVGGNSGAYLVLDQTLYRGGAEGSGSVAAFVRLAASPSDRNLISTYVDGGITFKGLLLPGRPNDVLGIGLAYAQIAGSVRRLDQVAMLASETLGGPKRRAEGVLEITYQAEIVPGWTIQPDFQYVFHPSASVTNPRTGSRIKNAAIVGLRTTVSY
jgi:porin